MDRALEALEQDGGHEPHHALLAAARGRSPVLVGVLGRRAGVEVDRGEVDRQLERGERVGDLRVAARVVARREARAQRERLEPLGERTDGGDVVVALDVPARAGDGDAVEDLEEVEVEPVRERSGGALGGRELRPVTEHGLGVAEHQVDRFVEPELPGPCVRVALVGELELVVKVAEPVVDGRGREHQHLGLDAVLDHLVEQPLETVALRLVLDLRGRVRAVAEVMGLVDDDEVVRSPVELLEVVALDGLAPVARQVGVVEHVVAQAVGRDRVVDVVLLVGEPVVGQTLGAEDEHVAVEQLVILDHGERGERLAQTHAVRKDAAVVGLELVDDGEDGVPLEIVEQVPDLALLEARALLGENVLGHVLQEFAEDAVEGGVVDELRRILAVHSRDGIDHGLRDVLQLARIPGGVELSQILARHVPRDPHGHGELLAGGRPEGGRRQALDGLERRGLGTVDDEVTARRAVGVPVGAELRLLPDPFGAFARDGLLLELVLELDLEVRAADAALAVHARDVVLALLLLGLDPEERRLGVDEAEGVAAFQLLFEFSIAVDGEQRRRYRDAVALADLLYEPVLEDLVLVIEIVRQH